jgi:lipopolysaccharide biosynthesis glycosyltransferase
MQDFLNVFFRDKYKPIPSNYNLVLAMLWRHPENIELEKVKVVHYCANVSNTTHNVHHDNRFNLILQQVTNVLDFFFVIRVLSHGGTMEKGRTCREKTSRCW